MSVVEDSSGAKEERWGTFTKLILPAVTAARQRVGITESTFRTHTFHSYPREFFLWTALDEVLKTGVFLMELDGFLAEGDLPRASPDDSDSIDRAIEAVILEEQRLRSRRLCELFLQVVLFAQKDVPELYKHFLLIEDLVGAAGYNADLEEFHGAPSAWVGARIDMTLSDLQNLAAHITPDDAWYARLPARPIQASDWRNLQTSVRQRIIRGLPLMTNLERLAVGTTYVEAFGMPSGTIHYRAGDDPVDHSRESTVHAEGVKLSLMAVCILRRIHHLLGSPAIPQLEQLSRVVDSNAEATRLMESLNLRPTVALGDIVAARGYLGQVVEERLSSYGYRSLRIELIAERPLPDLDADWFRVRDVVRVFSKEQMVARIRAKLEEPNAVVDDEVLRASAVSAWNLGLREQVRAGRATSRSGANSPAG